MLAKIRKYLVYYFIGAVILTVIVQRLERRKSSPEQSGGATVASDQATLTSGKPFEMPITREIEAEALDAIAGVNSLKIILGEKFPNKVKLFNYIEDNYNSIGVQCRHEACENLRYAMRALKKVAKDPNDLEATREAGQYLRIAAEESEKLKRSPAYKLIKKKPLFIHDGVYAIESEIKSRAECKLFGDAIHMDKKKSVVAFVKPGRTVSKDILASESPNINCIYRYNSGGKSKTQVMLAEEINGNWP